VSPTERSIGPVGTALRIMVGLVLVYVAGGASGLDWDGEWYDAAGGLVTLPALTVAAGLVARRYTARPLRFAGPLATTINCGVIIALVLNPYTGGAVTLFYAATLLVGGWRGQAGCEGTVISNWVLGRDHQVGCPIFSPIDQVEARVRRRRITWPPAEPQYSSKPS
jgi:hypothetical protein